MENNRREVLKTLAYFDIFDYSPTLDELYWYCPKRLPKEAILTVLKKSKEIRKIKDFYCLNKRKKIVALRAKRQRESGKKLILGKNISFILSFLPTIRLIGISGALAMQNCEKDDDIDIFIVAQKQTVWTTRLLTLLILEILGKRRARGGVVVNNKICLNMLLDEQVLRLSSNRQNIYGAHEIVQLIPLFERGQTYKKFIQANKWVKKFLPNSDYALEIHQDDIKKAHMPAFLRSLTLIPFFSEPFAQWVQKKYMKRITKEEVSDTVLAFHPTDYSQIILKEYQKRVKKLI